MMPRRNRNAGRQEDLDRMRAMQDLRRSSAATPIPSGKTYNRRSRSQRKREEDDNYA